MKHLFSTTDSTVTFGDVTLDRLIIYCSCPMSIGDRELNAKRGIDLAQAALEEGYIPIVPALSYWWNKEWNNSYSMWLCMDLGLLMIADALIYLEGPSVGVEVEKAFAREYHIPIVTSIRELNEIKESLLSKKMNCGTAKEYAAELI